MRHPRHLYLAMATCVIAVAHADAALIGVIVRGHVSANDVLIGQYAGVPIGTPVEFTARVDTSDVFSDEPQNFTTWYHVDYRLATFQVGGLPIARGLHEGVVSDSVVIFSGGDVYYQVDVPTVYFGLPEVTLLHCQFDGIGSNPFNNTGRLEENLGTYSAEVFDRTRHFRLMVAHPGPPLTFRDMLITADTFTFVEVPAPGSATALLVCVAIGARRRR